jgi:hypothetical protein
MLYAVRAAVVGELENRTHDTVRAAIDSRPVELVIGTLYQTREGVGSVRRIACEVMQDGEAASVRGNSEDSPKIGRAASPCGSIECAIAPPDESAKRVPTVAGPGAENVNEGEGGPIGGDAENGSRVTSSASNCHSVQRPARTLNQAAISIGAIFRSSGELMQDSETAAV